MKFLVLAGGSGTKLWPKSREKLPKQFQDIIGEKTLFRTNVEALLSRYAPEDIFISVKKSYLEFAKKDAPEIPDQNFIIEPDFKKNQGPATGYAALKAAYYYPDEPFMVIQSDCLRLPSEKFIQMTEEADRLVKSDRRLITGGVRPLYPEMGSDYLQLGEKVKSANGIDVFKIDKFIPRLGDFEKTKELISNFYVSTHCNHHCWFAEDLLNAFKEFRPNWYEKLSAIRDSFGTPDEESITDKLYSELEPGNVEEVTRFIFERDGNVILLPFNWIDIGTWDAVHNYFAVESNNKNYIDGNVIAIDTENTLIKGNPEKLIATIGIDNLVIVDTDDILFVCNKDKTVDVKKVLEELKNKKLEKYL